MIHIRHAIARAVSAAAIAVVSLFDRGVDGVVTDFLKLDSKLEAFLARQYARVETEAKLRADSAARQRAAMEAEISHREASHSREDDLHVEVARAQRIRAAVKSLIGD